MFFSQIARELDQILERYGRNVTTQIKVPVDLQADPRRTNNTWESWIKPEDMLYEYNAAAHLIHLAYCAHIGIVLATVAWNAFI